VSAPRTVATVSEKSNGSSCNRYYYAYLTEQFEVGQSSKHTPQHITLFPPFVAYQLDVLEVAEKVASEFDPFHVELGERAMFGPENNIPVAIIKPNESINLIHRALFQELERRNISIPPNQYIGDGYVPHVAIKPNHAKLDETKPLNIEHIAVVRKCDDIKTVMAKYALGGGK